MEIRIGSTTKGGMYIERWLHPGNDKTRVNGAWLVRIGETETMKVDSSKANHQQDGWLRGTIAPLWLLVRTDWAPESEWLPENQP